MKKAAKTEIETKVPLATSISQTIWSIGAGCSTLPCSAKDLKHVLQLFDKDIPNIKDAYEVKTLDDKSLAQSCLYFSRGTYKATQSYNNGWM